MFKARKLSLDILLYVILAGHETLNNERAVLGSPVGQATA